MSEVVVLAVRGRVRCDSSMCGNAADVSIRFIIGGTTAFQSKNIHYCVEHFKAFSEKVTKMADELGISRERVEKAHGQDGNAPDLSAGEEDRGEKTLFSPSSCHVPAKKSGSPQGV